VTSQPEHLDPLDLVPLNEAVKKTKRSRRTLYRDIEAGRLYSVLLGNRRMIPRAELMRYVYGDNGNSASPDEHE
jgi:excisionase family DNA binding protein